jgi:hypothetical protein
MEQLFRPVFSLQTNLVRLEMRGCMDLQIKPVLARTRRPGPQVDWGRGWPRRCDIENRANVCDSLAQDAFKPWQITATSVILSCRRLNTKNCWHGLFESTVNLCALATCERRRNRIFTAAGLEFLSVAPSVRHAA